MKLLRANKDAGLSERYPASRLIRSRGSGTNQQRADGGKVELLLLQRCGETELDTMSLELRIGARGTMRCRQTITTSLSRVPSRRCSHAYPLVVCTVWRQRGKKTINRARLGLRLSSKPANNALELERSSAVDGRKRRVAIKPKGWSTWNECCAVAQHPTGSSYVIILLSICLSQVNWQ